MFATEQYAAAIALGRQLQHLTPGIKPYAWSHFGMVGREWKVITHSDLVSTHVGGRMALS